MKIKRITALVIAFAIMVSGVTVFATANDATDATYYTTAGYHPKNDYEGKTEGSIPTTASGSNVSGYSAGIYLKDETGMFQWIGRYKDYTSEPSAAGYNEGQNVAFGATGEYVIQCKIKFMQEDNCDAYSSMEFVGLGTNSGNKYFGFGFGKINTLDDVPEKVHFKVGTSVGGNQTMAKNELAEIALKSGVWYTVRNIYNFDDNTARFEIIDANGNVTATDNIPVGNTVANATNRKWNTVRLNVNKQGINGLGIDDFTIAKTTHRPLVAEYDDEKGSVTLGGTKVNANQETPVAYNSNSAVTLNVTANEGYKISDIILNGQSIGADISDIQLKNVKSAQNVKVIFEENITTPSIGGSKADYIIAQPDYKDGYSFVAYYKIALPADCELGSYGMYFGLKDGTPLKLVAKAITEDGAYGVFGVRVYGDAINDKDEYAFKGFANISKSGEAESEYVSEEVVK